MCFGKVQQFNVFYSDTVLQRGHWNYKNEKVSVICVYEDYFLLVCDAV